MIHISFVFQLIEDGYNMTSTFIMVFCFKLAISCFWKKQKNYIHAKFCQFSNTLYRHKPKHFLSCLEKFLKKVISDDSAKVIRVRHAILERSWFIKCKFSFPRRNLFFFNLASHTWFFVCGHFAACSDYLIILPKLFTYS